MRMVAVVGRYCRVTLLRGGAQDFPLWTRAQDTAFGLDPSMLIGLCARRRRIGSTFDAEWQKYARYFFFDSTRVRIAVHDYSPFLRMPRLLDIL